jgi:hypothetical protein
MARWLFRLNIVLAGTSVLGLAVFIIWASSPFHADSGGAQGLAGIMFVVLVFALGALPYGVAVLAARAMRASVLAQSATAVTLAGMIGFGVRELHNAFVINPDAQSALILLFLPIVQIGFLIPLLGLRFARALWSRRAE